MKFTFNLNKEEFSMSKTVSKFALVAGLVLAMAFIFSCSSGDDDLPCLSCDEDSGGYGDKGNDIGNYRTVVIGTQTWMAENLNYAVAGSKCYGESGEVVVDWGDENDIPITGELSNAEVQANCDKYGRLYDWATAMAFPPSCNFVSDSCQSQIQPKHKGICPSGWHIPSNDDWEVLMDYVVGYETAGMVVYETAGTKLKATSGWDENGNGTDLYGFSALPGGGTEKTWSGYFFGVGGNGFWWSSEGYHTDYFRADYLYMDFYNEDAIWFNKDMSDLSSVRCLKD